MRPCSPNTTFDEGLKEKPRLKAQLEETAAHLRKSTHAFDGRGRRPKPERPLDCSLRGDLFFC